MKSVALGVNQETIIIQMPNLLDKKHQYWPISLLFLQLPIGHQSSPLPPDILHFC